MSKNFWILTQSDAMYDSNVTLLHELYNKLPKLRSEKTWAMYHKKKCHEICKQYHWSALCWANYLITKCVNSQSISCAVDKLRFLYLCKSAKINADSGMSVSGTYWPVKKYTAWVLRIWFSDWRAILPSFLLKPHNQSKSLPHNLANPQSVCVVILMELLQMCVYFKSINLLTVAGIICVYWSHFWLLKIGLNIMITLMGAYHRPKKKKTKFYKNLL